MALPPTPPILPSSSGGAAAAGGLGFQSQVGAFFALQMLCERQFDHELGLGSAQPLWIRFETEAPVDDILIATSSGGFLAIQAKTSLELSPRPNGGLAKTVQQFVRHWLICKSGTSDQLWNRPLDADLDRLVLAVGIGTPASIRVDLPAALRLHQQPGTAALSQNQARALGVFSECVEAAWKASTTEPWSPDIISSLAKLISIWTFDPSGADGRSLENLATAAAAPGQSRALLTALFHTCNVWMAQRGGADLPTLRRALIAEEVKLAAPPAYATDIATLQAHSMEIASALERYEAIEQGGLSIHVPRECSDVAIAAAGEGSFLVIGEPGSGKSAVINSLARHLRSRGDVVQLAVDRYNVENLEGLRNELSLSNDFVKVLSAWDGPADGWLIIDALDATRGGKGEGAFRALIERTLALKSRWKVIASIRTFDLRMGVRFRELFKGDPPSASYLDSSFPQVRHVRVPPWSPTEFDQIVGMVPGLEHALAGSSPRLRELAQVPFNTRLINELLQSGVVAASLHALSSQAELLRLYWDRRIEELGSPAQACLLGIVRAMADMKALRAPIQVALQNPGAFDALCQQGVLVRVENDRYVQFRHHLLFDYVASRLLLDMDGVVSGRETFPKAKAKGLMLAPALGFLLQELWASQSGRTRYWTAIEQVVGDHQGDPILRSAASRLSAELPEKEADTAPLAVAIRSGSAKAVVVLGHVIAALAVRLEDDGSRVVFPPWNSLAGALAYDVSETSVVLRFLLHLLLDVAVPRQITQETGAAARALLQLALNQNDIAVDVSSVIPFVAATYATDPDSSRILLSRIFEESRFAEHGWEDVPALCRQIKRLMLVAPDFVAEVYRFAFGASVERDVVTRLGGSRILSLTSNARQDYASAIYALNQIFPEFLRNHPAEATAAFTDAVNAYVARVHPPGDDRLRAPLSAYVNGIHIRITPDLSYIWASNPDGNYAKDGEALVKQFALTLQGLPHDEAIAVCNELVSRPLPAIIWARLLYVAVHRGDALVDFLWPFAACKALLLPLETRKDAIDVVSVGYSRRTEAERSQLEYSALSWDASDFGQSEERRLAFLSRLFEAIEATKLVTPEARDHVSAVRSDLRATNERPFRVTTGWSTVGKFDWIDDLDRGLPANARMMSAIDAASDYFGLPGEQRGLENVEATRGLSLLNSIASALGDGDLHQRLKTYGEGVIGEGCHALAKGQLLVVGDATLDLAGEFLRLLEIAVKSDDPEVEEDTEAKFEEFQSWGSPAPRVEAASALLQVCWQRPDLFLGLSDKIDLLLMDRHPAVRLQAVGNLLCIWDLDRTGFWARLALRSTLESNLGVLVQVIATFRRVLHADHERTALHLTRLLDRFSGTPVESKVAEMAADCIAILAISYAQSDAQKWLSRWVSDPAVHKDPLHKVLVSLREVIGVGLRPGEGDQPELRHRAQQLLHSIVAAASGHLDLYDARQDLPESELQRLRACMELVDTASMELYFATGRRDGTEGGLSDDGCATFLTETAPTIQRIGDCAAPNTIYHLLELIEILAPYGPETAFDLTAHAVMAGGRRGGYQYESLGAGLMVRLVGAFLADHKEIFEDTRRQQALVDCLEIFMEAGWTAAHRLLYRLPELIQ